MARKILGLAMTLVLASGVFAIDIGDTGLSVTGNVQTGVSITGWAQEDAGKNGEGAAVVNLYSAEADSDSAAIRATVGVGYKKDNIEAKIGIRAQDNFVAFNGAGASAISQVFKVSEAWGKLYLFNRFLNITAGNEYGAIWNSGAGSAINVTDSDYDNNKGVRLEVNPIEGLSAGITLFAPLGYLEYSSQWASPGEHLKFTVIGLKYEMANLFKASLATTFNKEEFEGLWDYKNYTFNADTVENYVFKDKTFFGIMGGASVLAVPNLDASIDFKFETGGNLKDTTLLDLGNPSATPVPVPPTFATAKSISTIIFGVGGKYTLKLLDDAFTLPVTLKFKLDGKTTEPIVGDKVDNSTGTLTFAVEPAYKINDAVTVSLYGEVNAELFASADTKKAADPINDGGDYKGAFNFQIKPKAAYSLNGITLYTFYKLAAENAAGHKDAQDTKNAKITHTIQIEFGYSF